MAEMLAGEKFFEDEQAAMEMLERAAWSDEPVCPHCNYVGAIYDLRKTRAGLRKCPRCQLQFTIRIGTRMERSHVPAYKWLQAAFLIAAYGKGMSARRLSRVLQLSYKSAWHLSRIIREAQSEPDEPHGVDAGAHVDATA